MANLKKQVRVPPILKAFSSISAKANQLPKLGSKNSLSLDKPYGRFWYFFSFLEVTWRVKKLIVGSKFYGNFCMMNWGRHSKNWIQLSPYCFPRPLSTMVRKTQRTIPVVVENSTRQWMPSLCIYLYQIYQTLGNGNTRLRQEALLFFCSIASDISAAVLCWFSISKGFNWCLFKLYFVVALFMWRLHFCSKCWNFYRCSSGMCWSDRVGLPTGFSWRSSLSLLFA